MMTIPFNGGKMRHIFKPGKGCYEDGFSCGDAQRCWQDPNTIVTLKVHGECCILIKTPIQPQQQQQPQQPQQQQQQQQDLEQGDNGGGKDGDILIDKAAAAASLICYEWIFATRFDSKGKPFPKNHIPLPLITTTTNTEIDDDGRRTVIQPLPQPAVEGQHTYCFTPLDKDAVVGKGSKRSYVGRDTYAAIAAGVKNGNLPDPNNNESGGIRCPDFVTVEWIGRKHQGNVDCLDVDHALYVHGSTVVTDFPPVPRTREQVAAMVATSSNSAGDSGGGSWSMEGVVLYWPVTGERFKLRFDMLVPDSLFAQHMKKKSSEALAVTPAFTSIKPKVIQAAAASTSTTANVNRID
jgi:hypothetical protein